MARLELPRVDKVPPEDPLEQILPGCHRGELQAGAAPPTAHAQEPPVALLCLLAFQSLCYLDVSGQGKPCRGRAASTVLVTAGAGTWLLVVPPASSHRGVSLSSRNPGMSAASQILRAAGPCPGSGTPRVAPARVKKRLLAGDLRAPPQGDKAVRGGDLGEVGQGQSCPSSGVWVGAGGVKPG